MSTESLHLPLQDPKFLATSVAVFGNKSNTVCYPFMSISPFGYTQNTAKTCKFSILIPKIHFKVSQTPINVARDRLDILLHFPNDWYKDIEG